MKKPAVRNNQEGSALIPVVCVLLVLAAIVLSMMFAAYQVYTSGLQTAIKQQTKVMAQSLDQTLEEELRQGNTQENTLRAILYTKINEAAENNQTEGEQDVQMSLAADAGQSSVPDQTDAYIEWEKKGNIYVLTTHVTVRRQKQQYTVISVYHQGIDNGETSDSAAKWTWTKQN